MIVTLLALALSSDISILAVPMPMEVVKERLATSRPPVGLWYFHLLNKSAKPESITREEILMRIAEWCETHKSPMPLILTKEVAAPILLRTRGGRLQLVSRLALYAGAGAAISGVPWAAAAGPVADLVSRSASARLPDISTLDVALPDSVTLAPGQGATLSAWSGKMRQAPKVLGPMR